MINVIMRTKKLNLNINKNKIHRTQSVVGRRDILSYPI